MQTCFFRNLRNLLLADGLSTSPGSNLRANGHPFLLALLAVMALSGRSLAQEEAPRDFMENRYVVVLSVYKTFEAAKEDAVKIAKASGVPFSMEGRVYEKKRGLIYPDSFEDEAFRGGYLARSYDTTVLPGSEAETQYLSVERSDGYDGFKPGFYMVVAGIQAISEDAGKQADRFRAWAPTTYVKKTKIYMGCLH
jgi:hypothetical protein